VFAGSLVTGKAFATAWREQKNEDGRAARVIVSTAVEADVSHATQQAVAAVQAVSAVPSEALLDAHRAAWLALYRRAAHATAEAQREDFFWTRIHQREAQPFSPWPAAPSPEFSEP
jgi:hypothetical protein